jgi:REP element-mobilizing transposase RayT
MADKFQNKYRIPSVRWQSWDYSSEGLYFITINTVHHCCFFGSIVDKEMHLSAYGRIVADEWDKSFEIRQELFCDAFVIMPNHIHAILRIQFPPTVAVEPHGRAALRDADADVASHSEPHGCAALRDTAIDTVADADIHSRAVQRGVGNGIAYREPKSISSFVAGFKSAVTARINELRNTKGQAVWQSRFHDHVIRDFEECRRIGAYIDSNIENWKDDRYYQ